MVSVDLDLRMLELSRERWERHWTTLVRALVLLSRLQSGEKLQPEQMALVGRVRRDLREFADLVEGVIE